MLKQKTVITRAQIERALRQFELRGGHIVRFPAQTVPRNGLVALHGNGQVHGPGYLAPIPSVAETVAASAE